MQKEISQGKLARLQCILVCAFRWESSENSRLQTTQANGFSPKWMRIWRLRFPLYPKTELQRWHSNLDIPECTFLCRRKPVFDENDLEHRSQDKPSPDGTSFDVAGEMEFDVAGEMEPDCATKLSILFEKKLIKSKLAIAIQKHWVAYM